LELKLRLKWKESEFSSEPDRRFTEPARLKFYFTWEFYGEECRIGGGSFDYLVGGWSDEIFDADL
jgi:hypothetical protein